MSHLITLKEKKWWLIKESQCNMILFILFVLKQGKPYILSVQLIKKNLKPLLLIWVYFQAILSNGYCTFVVCWLKNFKFIMFTLKNLIINIYIIALKFFKKL